MAYTLDISLALGSSKAGVTLNAQLVDSSLALVGSAVSTGFNEVGNGYYLWHYESFPDSFRGGVKFYEQGSPNNILAFVSVNPQEAENLDVKVSEVCSGGFGGTVSVNVGHSSVVLENSTETDVGNNTTIEITAGTQSVGPEITLGENKKVPASEIINITTGTQGSSVQITPGVR